MFKYAVKRVFRSYKLFLALTIGVLVATTFFASTNIAADLLARDSLEASIEGVVYDIVANSVPSNWTSKEFNEIENKLSEIPEITEQTRTSRIYLENYNNTSTNFTVTGLEWNSDMVEDFQYITGRTSLEANETYVVSGSTNESLFKINDIIEMKVYVTRKVAQNIIIVENGTIVQNITRIITKVEQVSWNLTIAGFVSIPDDRRYAMEQNPFAGILLTPYGFGADLPYNLLLSDWALTLSPLLESCNQIENRTGVWVWNSIHMQVDRANLIDPYNIGNSVERLTEVVRKVRALVGPYGATLSSGLIIPLTFYTTISLAMNVAFIALSLPIFFMAYFTGTMVSDVSYNLRRREIGLLLTKGYNRSTIRNMFLIEGIFIGALSGVASAFLGAGIAFYTLRITRYDYVSVFLNNSTSIILSIILGMTLALISVWRPANRASKLEILDALKQYILIEETSEYKRLLPTITFVLGTYKLIVWILAIDMNTLLSQISPGNFFLALMIVVWLGIDGILNFLGPIAFLYGATKIFMRGSPKFQEAVVTAGKRYFGAFGNLATRNVKRNPARNAAMVFLLSLIVSYGIFTIGSLYAEYDRVERNIRYTVGADVRIELEGDANITSIMEKISDITDVVDVTPEYRLSLHAGDISIDTRGIRPDEWPSIAFWESDWFIGDFQSMVNDMGDDGIILSIDIARDLDLDVDDTFHIKASGSSAYHEVRIVGLVGYQSPLEGIALTLGVDREDALEFTARGDYPSFISESFLNETNIIGASSSNILIKMEDGVNGTYIQEVLDEEFDEIIDSYSYTSHMKNYFERPIESGITKIRWVAVVFAIVLALVGTGLVIILGLKDKDAEIALLTVRGFSKWQLFKTLLAEMLVMVLFALILGSLVGFVEIFGNINLENQNTISLIRTKMIVGGLAGSTMLVIIGVVLLSAIVPVWWASRRPESKVDILRA